MPSRCCIQCVSKSARPCSGHRTGKDQSSPQFPRRAVLNTGHLHSSPTLVRSCLKSCMLGFSLMWTKNFQAGFRKGRGTRAQTANIHWIIEKAREFQKNIYLCFIDCTKAFDCVDHNKLWKILRWEFQTTLPASWQTPEPCVEQLTGSRLRKEHHSPVCSHPVCLTSMLSTSWEMPGWVSNKLESR